MTNNLTIILNVCTLGIGVLAKIVTVFRHPGNHSMILTILLLILVLTIILNVCGQQLSLKCFYFVYVFSATSRSASPSAQFNYQTYQTSSGRPSLTGRPSGIPAPRSSASSLETSRETSPTRMGAIPKARYDCFLLSLRFLDRTHTLIDLLNNNVLSMDSSTGISYIQKQIQHRN